MQTLNTLWRALIFRTRGYTVIEHHGEAAREVFQRMFISAMLRAYV
jgi:hypothetical protein